jgi:GntR family transcriptional regulator
LGIPPAAVAERLDLDAEKDIVVVRRRVRYVDDVPFQVADSYFPENLARGTALMQPKDVSVPGGLLASIGHAQKRLVDEIQIRMPTKDESARLGLPAGTPVAEHMRTGYDAEGRPVRVMVTVAPGDRHTLVYELDPA